MSNNKNPHIERSCAEKEPSTNSDKSAKEGSGEVTMTAPTPEQKWIDVKDDGFGENPVISTYARASMQAAKKGGYSQSQLWKDL